MGSLPLRTIRSRNHIRESSLTTDASSRAQSVILIDLSKNSFQLSPSKTSLKHALDSSSIRGIIVDQIECGKVKLPDVMSPLELTVFDLTGGFREFNSRRRFT